MRGRGGEQAPYGSVTIDGDGVVRIWETASRPLLGAAGCSAAALVFAGLGWRALQARAPGEADGGVRYALVFGAACLLGAVVLFVAWRRSLASPAVYVSRDGIRHRSWPATIGWSSVAELAVTREMDRTGVSPRATALQLRLADGRREDIALAPLDHDLLAAVRWATELPLVEGKLR